MPLSMDCAASYICGTDPIWQNLSNIYTVIRFLSFIYAGYNPDVPENCCEIKVA